MLYLNWTRCKNSVSKRRRESIMKTKLQCFSILLALFACINQTASAQTNKYLFTGYETNITLAAGTYNITAYGAQGGSVSGNVGGLGAEMGGKFNFSGETTLTLLVGGGAQYYSGYGGNGGGGGSFVVNGSTPLVVAGGGGGGGDPASGFAGAAGLISTSGSGGANGVIGNGIGGVAGTSGSGGGGGSNAGSGGGGGGYSSGGGNGAYYGEGTDGKGGGGYSSGGAGGTGYVSYFGGGGFGGGGGAGIYGGGGGGGYSGGGGGGSGESLGGGGGGGGGSIIDSSATSVLAEVSGIASPDDSTGNGEIIITTVSTNSAPTSPAIGITTVSSLPVVVWPASATNYVLQMTTNLNSPNWVTISNGVPFVGLQITNGPANAFFRLH
jgi:hypothetical protein